MDTKLSVTGSPSLDIFISSPPTCEFKLHQIFEKRPSLQEKINSENFTAHDINFSLSEIIRVCSSGNLNTPEYKILMFFCVCVYHQTNNSLRDWAASKDGKSFFRETLQGFRNKETKEQICVRALSLVGLGTLRSYSSDLSSKDYFMDFGRLVEGDNFYNLDDPNDRNRDNKQDVIKYMLAALYRAIGKDCDTRLAPYFDMMIIVPLSPSLDTEDKTDKAFDLYCKFRLEGRDHTHAWELTLKEAGATIR
ncbi:hypothetical protein GGI35DRAFT_126619 [Trichoderma velutinum]